MKVRGVSPRLATACAGMKRNEAERELIRRIRQLRHREYLRVLSSLSPLDRAKVEGYRTVVWIQE